MTYVLNIFGILGGFFCLYEIYTRLKKFIHGMKYIPWEAVQEATNKLHENIKTKSFDPDIIVGVGRGGVIAAGLLAARFRQDLRVKGRIIQISAIDRIYIKKHIDLRKDVVISGIHNLDIRGKNVLVLNADLYTGGTLEKALQGLKSDEPKSLKTACFFEYIMEGKKPAFEPDFVGEFIESTKKKKLLPWRLDGYPLEDEVDIQEKHAAIIVLHGLVATGKTSVANAIAKDLEYIPIYSDWYWHKYGLQDREKDPSISVKHNSHMLDLCWSVIASDRSAVLDCTTRWASFRKDLRTSFEKRGVIVVFVRCICSENSALSRIDTRKFISFHDFGTKQEYERVKNDYQPIGEEEFRKINLLDVDTEKLKCTVANATSDEAKDLLEKLCHAIERHYFTPLRNLERNHQQ